MACLAHVSTARAGDCVSQSSGNWNSPARWSCNHVPAPGDAVFVAAAHSVTLDTNATIEQVTVNGTLQTDNGNRILTLTKTSPLFIKDNAGVFAPGNSTVVVNANSDETLTSGAITFNNLQLIPAITNASLTYNFGAGAVTVNGNLDINPSKPTGNQRLLTVNMGGSLTVLGTTTIQATGASATSQLNTGGASYALTSGRLVVGSAGTFTANGSTVTLNGATGPLFTQTGTFNANSSTVVMNSPSSVALNSGAITFGALTVNMAGQTAALGNAIIVNDAMTLSAGALFVGANTLTLNGPAIAITAGSLSTTAASNLVFGGTSSGVSVPASVAALNNLTVNNANGVTLNSSATLAGVMTLSSGVISTGANTMTMTANCPASVVRPANGGYVSGNLRLAFSSGLVSCTYHVGSGTVYAPINVTKNTGGAGSITGTTAGSEHPQISASAIDPTKDANRNWTLSGDTIGASASYNLTFNFTAGDVDGGAAAANFAVGKYDGITWTSLTPVTANALSTAVTGVAGPFSSSGFAVGESIFVCSVPPGLPSTMTCVCDNFGRATLNPSTIYGGNWSVSSSSGGFGLPRIQNSGYLRMTDGSSDVATAATMPGTFPAAGNLITVEFKHYAYGGSGADGIALTLSDATVPATPGAYGGSLGYAQKNNATCAQPPCNGFNGGWVGIGIDEYGNFSNPTEGRSGGPGFSADSVAVRGSGSLLTGYPYLGGTNSLTPGIDDTTSAAPSFGHVYRITVDARCYQLNTANADINCNNAALVKKTQVRVNRDTSGTGTFNASNQIVNFDAYAANSAQANVPANWKLSFTGSTGSAMNFHEIQGIKVCAQTITPPAGFGIQVDNLGPSTCGTPGGNPSSPIVTVTARDTNGNTVTNYTKTIALSATLLGGGASTSTWRKVGTGANLPGNQYTFTLADNGVAQFYLTNANTQSVYITVTEVSGTLASSLATPVQFSGGFFVVANTDGLQGNPGGGLVAGRSHLMTVTRTNACGATVNGYAGIRNLDGWYTPVAGDHPTGADAPRICAPNANNACLPNTGACQTLSIAAPAVNAASNFLPPLNFSNGSANFCVSTSDVGKYAVSLRDDTVNPAVTGTSSPLAVRPFAVAVFNVRQSSTGTNNPADSTAYGPVFAKAGSNFEATVAGYLWNSAGDANNDGLPDAGISLATISAAGIAPHYADTVKLAATAPFYPPAGLNGADPTLGNVVIGAGSNTHLTLVYPEVGTFTMAATPAANYLNTTNLNLANRVALYTKTTAPPIQQNALVGRFIPNHFVLSSASIDNRTDISPACSVASNFTYMDERMDIKFTLTALNLLDQTTKNYTGSYAKLPVSPATIFSFGAVDGTTPLTSRLDTTIATTGMWTGGAAAMIVPVVFTRATDADGSYEALTLGIAPQDADGVALRPGALNLDTDTVAGADKQTVGATRMLYGRLKIFNAFGSERLNLPVDVQAQYWSGSAYVSNNADNCTQLVGTNFSQAPVSGAAVATTIGASGSLLNGTGRIILAKPSSISPAGKTGSVDLNHTIPYLPGLTGRATFGVYKGGPLIYMREIH